MFKMKYELCVINWVLNLKTRFKIEYTNSMQSTYMAEISSSINSFATIIVAFIYALFLSSCSQKHNASLEYKDFYDGIQIRSATFCGALKEYDTFSSKIEFGYHQTEIRTMRYRSLIELSPTYIIGLEGKDRYIKNLSVIQSEDPEDIRWKEIGAYICILTTSDISYTFFKTDDMIELQSNNIHIVNFLTE